MVFSLKSKFFQYFYCFKLNIITMIFIDVLIIQPLFAAWIPGLVRVFNTIF